MVSGISAAMLLDRDRKSCGYGWLISKDRKGVYVMTTSDVLHRIKHDEDDQYEKLHFFIESCNDKEPTPCSIIKTEKKFVIVSSKKGSVLDYVVLRFKTSSKVASEKPLNVSKQCPEPLETVGVPYSSLGCPNKSFCQRSIVLQYPEDLINWLIKVGSRSSFHSVAKRAPSPGCDPTIDWKKARDLREVLIPYWKTDHNANECFSGLPLFTFQDSQVVGMCSRRVFITEEIKENHFINFGIRIDQIIADIDSKNPRVARSLFPDYF
ncbi:Hypothetical predicted protein [Paramuricea clavata]|uniref:Uncharacterized protein n=1 Tax=Paramuricea clavata TaxID=317549 RepID=A0A7D9KD39_PARCT|nr:Hypothetical predicted protein [Paramuricea clavata]